MGFLGRVNTKQLPWITNPFHDFSWPPLTWFFISTSPCLGHPLHSKMSPNFHIPTLPHLLPPFPPPISHSLSGSARCFIADGQKKWLEAISVFPLLSCPLYKRTHDTHTHTHTRMSCMGLRQPLISEFSSWIFMAWWRRVGSVGYFPQQTDHERGQPQKRSWHRICLSAPTSSPQGSVIQ